MLTLLLIRHATTKANEEHLYLGRMDSPISKRGYEELERLKGRLEGQKIDAIYTSPSQRCKSTLSYCLPNEMKPHEVEALQEIDFGEWDGKDFTWVKAQGEVEIQKMMTQKEAYCYPKGESLKMQHKRVVKWLNEMLMEHTKGTVLICGHSGTIRCILSELLVHNISLHWQFKIEPASLAIIKIDEGFPVIEQLNGGQ